MAKLILGPTGPVDLESGDRSIPVPLPAEICERYEEIVRQAAAHQINEAQAEERMRREVMPHVKVPVDDYRPHRDVLAFYPGKKPRVGGRG